MKRIGFFGGSFDPIHLGHLNLAVRMLESGQLDEVLFCPAFCSPFKIKTPPIASGEHRLEMIRLVTKGVPGFRITSTEIDHPIPSFTIDTLRRLPHEGVQYRLIVSEPTTIDFSRWKDPEALLKLAPPLIGLRGGAATKDTVIQMPLFDISSTEIRERIKKKIYCEHLVPKIALDYIAQHRLYC